ncbi:hypothetical protein N9544_07880 [Flavobacteriales bacterium]|nr:hypothetical protein [Flavobacteriales bacterium]
MKYTYLLASLLFLGSCGTESTAIDTTTNPESTEQETVEVGDVEKTTTEKLLGTWEYEDENMPVKQVITYQEDGTYQMKMASMNISGTWELNEGILITKSRPDSDGQKKTIIKLDSDSLCTFWEPQDGGVGRNMNYARKK